MKCIARFCFLLLLPVIIIAQNKTALLIANGEYENFSPLEKPVALARQLRDTLLRLDFDVTLITDAGRKEMRDGLNSFQSSVNRRGGIALFYYSGQTVQVDGTNYLVPVSAGIPDERSIRDRAVDADEVIAVLDDSAGYANIVIFDPCRCDSSFAGSAPGLAAMERLPDNVLVVYSAEAGTEAREGLFISSFLDFLERPGWSMVQILRVTGEEVSRRTGGGQIPVLYYDHLFSPVYPAGREDDQNIAAYPRKGDAPEGFVLVEAGTFTMGSPPDERYRDDLEIQHQVTLTRKFYMSKYEVTQDLWGKVMGTNPSDSRCGIGPDYPVNQVSWDDAVEFCNKLSLREGLAPVYSGSGGGDLIRCDFDANGYRLPTDAEWEYAARGGQLMDLYYLYPGSDYLDSLGWFDGNSGDTAHPVGLKKANELGLFDMGGNVSEWCWDWYGAEGSYGHAVRDPSRPAYGAGGAGHRVLRGGSWYSLARSCRSAFRNYCKPYVRSNVQGFRLVRTCP